MPGESEKSVPNQVIPPSLERILSHATPFHFIISYAFAEVMEETSRPRLDALIVGTGRLGRPMKFTPFPSLLGFTKI